MQLFDLRTSLQSLNLKVDNPNKLYDLKIWGNVNFFFLMHFFFTNIYSKSFLICLHCLQYFVCGGISKQLFLYDLRNPKVKLGTIRGHTRAIRSIIFNGTFVASASEDSTIRVYDTFNQTISKSNDSNQSKTSHGHTPENVQVFSSHTSKVLTLACQNYSNTLFSGSADSTVKIWNTSQSKLCWSSTPDTLPSLKTEAFQKSHTKSKSLSSSISTPEKTSVSKNRVNIPFISTSTSPLNSGPSSPSVSNSSWVWSSLFAENTLFYSGPDHSIKVMSFFNEPTVLKNKCFRKSREK